jgi:hypothetical protein
MHRLVHTWGQNRLDIQGLSQLSFGALQLLGKIIPIYRSNMVVELRLRSHFVASFTITRVVTDLVYDVECRDDLY